MRHVLVVFALFAASLAAAELPPAVLEQIAKLPETARPVETRVAANGALYFLLPNGCEIILKEKRTAPVVAVQAWMRTGAIHEGQWAGAGLSHFCEHMLFKGTTKRPTGTLDQEIRGSGGDDNAYTTSERTVYHITTEASSFGTAFDALADMLMDSTFPPEETVKEHAVVYKEIERHLDNPDSMLYEAFERLLYQVHPYREPVLGYPDRFQRVTREEVYGYYKERYSPHLCTYIAVGDFDAASVLPQMATTLGAWKRISVRDNAIPAEPPQVGARRVEITHPLCEMPKFIMAWPTVSLRDPDLYALDLLASILGDGRTSRLYSEIKDKQNLVLEISSYNYTPTYAGYFAVSAVAEESTLAKAEESVVQVLQKSLAEKATAEELARAKRKVFARHVQSQMTVEGIAEQLGSDWFAAGDLDFSARYARNMQFVTAEDLSRVALKYLVDSRRNTAILRPVKSVQAAVAAAQKQPAPSPYEELKKLAADGPIQDVKILEKENVAEFRLKPSGLRCVARLDPSLPVVNVAVGALGGTRWEPAEKAGAANLMAKMLDRGAKGLTKLQIAERVEGLGASLAPFAGRNAFGLQVSGLKEDAATLFELTASCLFQPSFPADELEKLREDVLQELALEDESLGSLNRKLLRPLLYGAHPYARNVLGTPETVKAVTLDDVKQLHAAWTRAGNLAICVTGDLKAGELVQLLTQHFGAAPAGAVPAPQVPPIAPLKEEGSGMLEKEKITGAVLTLGFRGAGLLDPDTETLDLMAGLLSGLGGRLNVELREKQGLAYAVGVQNDTQLDGGSIVFFIQTDAKSLDAALKGMHAEAEKLRTVPVPEKELASVKNYLSGTEAITLQDQSELAQRLVLAQLYGEGSARVFNRRSRLTAVTPQTLQAAAQKFLDSRRWVKTVVKPK